MVDISAIAGTVSALKGAVDIAQAMKGLHDAQTIQSKAIELNGKILEAQAGAFAANDERSSLIERIRELEKQLAAFETWEAEKSRYELKDVGKGSLAYSLKPAMKGTEHPHNLCAGCYQKRKKSILQPKYEGMHHLLVCYECNARLIVRDEVVGPSRVQTDFDPFGRF